jgi:hypothetical protein
MDLGKLFGYLVNVAMALAAAGFLYKATLVLKHEAMGTSKHGMVSLEKFNRRLERGK